jgi:rhodanese-related sulfurtransferase
MASTLNEIVTHIRQQIPHLDSETAALRRRADHGLLIDVREPSEHSEHNTPEAINIPRGVLEMKLIALEPDLTRPIYLHCASTVRAALSAEQLRRVGYENLFVVTGELSDIIQAHAN